MNILILGGTYFLGKRCVERLIQHKHAPTLLNRGSRKIFPGLETVIADRYNSTQVTSLLAGKEYDIVIDFCGYTLPAVKTIVEALDSHIQSYIFISSIAAQSLQTEYGKNKFLIERYLLKQRFKTHILRPAYIYGEDDYNKRTEYISDRIARGRIIRVRGDGNNLIRFDSVEEIVDIIINLVKLYPNYEIVDLNKKPISIKDFINFIAKRRKYKVKFYSKAKQTLNLPNYNYY